MNPYEYNYYEKPLIEQLNRNLENLNSQKSISSARGSSFLSGKTKVILFLIVIGIIATVNLILFSVLFDMNPFEIIKSLYF